MWKKVQHKVVRGIIFPEDEQVKKWKAAWSPYAGAYFGAAIRKYLNVKEGWYIHKTTLQHRLGPNEWYVQAEIWNVSRYAWEKRRTEANELVEQLYKRYPDGRAWEGETGYKGWDECIQKIHDLTYPEISVHPYKPLDLWCYDGHIDIRHHSADVTFNEVQSIIAWKKYSLWCSRVKDDIRQHHEWKYDRPAKDRERRKKEEALRQMTADVRKIIGPAKLKRMKELKRPEHFYCLDFSISLYDINKQ